MQPGQRDVEIELWNKAGQRIADISHLAQSRTAILRLNGTELLQFSLDLDKFEDYCASIGSHPRTIIWPNQTEVRVKYRGVYWFGAEVAAATPYLNQTGSTLAVRCVGFLDFFKSRYITKSYDQVESTEIAADMITTTQAKTNGDYGVTIGGQQFATGVLRDRNYERKNIKDAVVELTRLRNGKFDFRFTHDKQFETYEQLGSLRLNAALRYGDGGNITRCEVYIEGPAVANEITGVGSGFGEDQLTSVASDTDSQLANVLREQIAQFNSVTQQETLDQNTEGFLDQVKDVLEIPRVVVNSKEFDLGVTSVGDRIPLDLRQYRYTENVNGLYRIYEMIVAFDENDFAEITLDFDDQGADQDEVEE